MGPAVILGIIGVAGQFIDNPLIKRLLTNASKWIHTPVICGTEIDEWVLRFLYDQATPPSDDPAPRPRPENLEEIQERVDTMTPEAKAAAKMVRPINLPWIEPMPVEP
jgi:hypothetical protein